MCTATITIIAKGIMECANYVLDCYYSCVINTSLKVITGERLNCDHKVTHTEISKRNLKETLFFVRKGTVYFMTF